MIRENLIELRKKRDLGAILSDTFAFIRSQFKSFFGTYLKLVGPYLAFMLLVSVFYMRSFETLLDFGGTIESENDNYILNVNEDDYIAHKVSEATVENLEIHVDDIYASSSEQIIPAEYFPSGFHVYSGRSYKKDVIKFHVPISGNIQLLHCMPSSRILWTMDIEVSRDEFCFEIINFRDDAEGIVREKDSNIRSIMQQYENVRSEVERANAGKIGSPDPSKFEYQLKLVAAVPGFKSPTVGFESTQNS